MKHCPIKTLAVVITLQPWLVMAGPDRGSDTLVITARHWQETALQAPLSVTIEPFENTAPALTQGIAEVAEGSANVQLEQSSVQTRMVVRGVTAANTGLQDPLGYFIDGVALPLGASQAPVLFNAERTELIRGPQGALFGRNTESGAFRVISHSPDAAGDAWLSLSGIHVQGPDGGAGGQQRRVLSAGGSGALTDNLTAGVAVRSEHGGSGQYNLFDRSEEGGRVERLNLFLSADLAVSENTDISLRSQLESLDSGMERMRFANGNFQTAGHVTNYNRSAENERDTQVHSLTVNHDMGDMQLTAITGVTAYDREFVMDLDATILPAPASELDLENRMLSQEFRLTGGRGGAELRWLLGSYLFREESDIRFVTGIPSTTRVTDIEQQGVALFGQVEYPLSPRLRLSAGGRLEYIDMSGTQARSSFLGAESYAHSDGKTEWLPRLGIAYDLNDDSLLFASLARGYLPGGYNYNLAGSQSDFTYGAEFSDTAEVGLKTTFADERVDAQLSLFYTRSRDKQIVDLQPGGTQRISNAAEAEIYGLEVALDADLGAGWRGSADLGLMHAEATEYQTQLFNGSGFAPADLSGKTLPMAAPLTYGIGLAYDNRSPWFGQVKLKGSGDFYFDSQNLIRQKSYHTVDMSVGYRFAGPHGLTLSLAARNLFDKNYYIRAVNTPNGLLVEDSNPREVSLNIAARW